VIDRRGLCRAVAVVLGLPALAGCSLPGRDRTTPSPSPSPPAGLSVQGVRAPATAAIGGRFEYVVTLRNAGETPAALDTAVESRGTDGSWRPVGRFSAELPAGDRLTQTARLRPRAVGSRIYRLAATGSAWRVAVAPARRPFGGRILTPDGVAVTVGRPRPAPNVTGRTPTPTPTRTVAEPEAEAGTGTETGPGGTTDAPARRVVRVFVDTRNVANGPRRSPDPWDFTAETPTGPAAPVEGLARPYRAVRFGPGVERSGWLGFAVPTGVEPATLSVVWSETNAHGRAAARWETGTTPGAAADAPSFSPYRSG
jgi:hypothetical protein